MNKYCRREAVSSGICPEIIFHTTNQAMEQPAEGQRELPLRFSMKKKADMAIFSFFQAKFRSVEE